MADTHPKQCHLCRIHEGGTAMPGDWKVEATRVVINGQVNVVDLCHGCRGGLKFLGAGLEALAPHG